MKNLDHEHTTFDCVALERSADIVRTEFKGACPVASFVLGTGWSLPKGAFQTLGVLPFSDIPALGATSVTGHTGTLIWGSLNRRQFFVFNGRRHWYELDRREGYTPLVAIPYLSQACGSSRLILTQGVGGVTVPPRTFMIVADHIGPEDLNVFPGPHINLWRDEFAICTSLYDQTLRETIAAALRHSDVEFTEGIYRFWPAKQFQTPAEIRKVRAEGGNVVGKSLIFEAMYGTQLGLKIGAVCLSTNYAAGINNQGPDHVLHKQVGTEMEPVTSKVLEALMNQLALRA